MDYKKAGVDIEAGYKSVELMKEHIKKTMREEVLTNIGGFSGAFSLDKFKGMEHPTLVSGTDGVGTKLKLAFIMDKHDTIGIDCVAMCVNDIACAGGEPLFFLDYIACGKNFPEKIATIVSGVADGCAQSDAALIGGETAEMPGFYPEDEYDLAGFAVGIVDQKDLITGQNIKAGDVLVGIASSGVHSNGFSLVRKVFDMTKESLETYYDELGKTLGEALLAPISGGMFNNEHMVGRYEGWKEAWSHFAGKELVNQWFGNGLEYPNMGSLYMKTLYSMGYVGIILMIAFVASVVYYCVKVKDRKTFYTTIILAVMLLGTGVTVVSMEATQMSWFPMMFSGMVISSVQVEVIGKPEGEEECEA